MPPLFPAGSGFLDANRGWWQLHQVRQVWDGVNASLPYHCPGCAKGHAAHTTEHQALPHEGFIVGENTPRECAEPRFSNNLSILRT